MQYECEIPAAPKEFISDARREWTDADLLVCHQELLSRPSLQHHLIAERGFTLDSIKKYKIGITKSGIYTIPIHDDIGHLKNIRFYIRQSHKKFGWTGHTNKILFPILGLNGHNPLWIAEGEMDAIVANQHGLAAITTCSGAPSAARTLHDNRYVLGDQRRFILAYDNDEAGWRAAAEIGLKTFPGRIDGVVRWPSGFSKDVSDWFQQGRSASDLNALVVPFCESWATAMLRAISEKERANGNRQDASTAQEEINHLAENQWSPVQEEPPATISDAQEPPEETPPLRFPPFPIDIWPRTGFLGTFYSCCRHVAGFVPPQFHAAGALVAAGMVTERKVFIVNGTRHYYPNIYALLVGPSGCGKTTATDSVERFVRHQDPGMLMPQEFSAEKLVSHMSNHPSGLFLYPEAATLLSLFARTYAEGAYDFLLDLYDCHEEYTRATMKGDVKVTHPFASILAACTPYLFAQRIQHKDIESGFLPRFTFWITQEHGSSDVRPQKPTSDMTRALMESAKTMREQKGEFLLVGEVEEAFYAWADAGRRAASEEERPFFNRVYGYCLKFAILFEADRRTNNIISMESLNRATRLCDWLMASAKTLVGRFDGIDSRNAAIDRRVLALIEMSAATGGISMREIGKKLWLRSPEVRASLDALTFHEQISKDTRKRSRGPSAEVFVPKHYVIERPTP